MISAGLAVLAVFILLVGSEIWWQRRAGHGEFSRKFIHISVGSFVAFWPFFLSWRAIELLSLAFVIAILISKWLGLFQAIHSVQRPTWGEVFFGLAVGLIAFTTHDQWIYCAALLQMSLADGLAAVLGVRYGNSMRYLVFGHPKSIVGTLTFGVVSVVTLLAFNSHFPEPLALGQIIGLSLIAAVIENMAINGLDNLLVPLIVTLVLANA